MNLILFTPDELQSGTLPRDDPRSVHLIRVLRRQIGDPFDMAVIDGPHGKGRITGIGAGNVRLAFDLGARIDQLFPITLGVATPRPQTARKILQEATALGVSRLLFFQSEKAEPSYRDSRLWTTGEYRRHLITGAEQAFSSRIPTLEFGLVLESVLEKTGGECRLALDNYEAGTLLADCEPITNPAVLLVGAERGWSATERNALRAAGCVLAHLGSRVLRTETAATAGLSILKTRLNCW